MCDCIIFDLDIVNNVAEKMYFCQRGAEVLWLFRLRQKSFLPAYSIKNIVDI